MSRMRPQSLVAIVCIGLGLVPSPAPARGAPSRAPISAWRFDATSPTDGSVPDRAGDVDGTLRGDARWQIDVAPTALIFDGDENVVTLASEPDLDLLPREAMAVEAWVRVDRARDWGGVVNALQDNGSYEHGWLLGFRGDRFAFALAGRGDGAAATKLTYLTADEPYRLGEWHHVVGTYDGRAMELWIDGRRSARSEEQSGPISYPPRFLYAIGAYHDDDEHYAFAGALHSATVWDRALERDEIAARFAAGAPEIVHPALPSSAPPRGAWDFGALELRGSDTVDASGAVHARTQGDVAITDGHLSLDGTSSLLAPITAEDRDRLTIEAWISPDVIGDAGIAATAGDARSQGWRLGIEGGLVVFECATSRRVRPDAGARVASKTLPRAGRWYHVVATYDAFSSRLFVDGELEAASADGFGALVLPEERGVVLGSGFDGLIESIRVWDHPLPPESVARRHLGRRPSFPAPFDLARGPWIRPLSRKSIEVSWTTREPTPSVIAWGAGPEFDRRAEDVTPKVEHRLVVEGLTRDAVHSLAVRAFLPSRAIEVSSPTYTWDHRFVYAVPRPDGDAPSTVSGTARSQAQGVVDTTGVDRGYALVVGEGSAELARELARLTELRVVVLDDDDARIASARALLDAAGLYGGRVSVQRGDLATKPYAEWTFNLIVLHGKTRPAVPARRLRSLLRPAGGALVVSLTDRDPGTRAALVAWGAEGDLGEFVPRDDGDRLVASWTRPPLEGAGEWSHQYGSADNAACSKDEIVKGELEVLWWGRPGPRPMPDRGARNPAPLAAGGWLFVQGDRTLFGIDAYNGTIRWNYGIPAIRRSNMPRDSSNMAASPDHLYVAQNEFCQSIDAGTGALARVFSVPSDAPTSPSTEVLDWGYLGCVGDALVGTGVKRGSAYLGDDGEWFDGPEVEATAKVTSPVLFVFDRHTGELRWTRRAGTILNSTITMQEGRIFFVESRSAAASERTTGRLAKEAAEDQWLVALDLERGQVVWERPEDFSAGERVLYVQGGEGTLIVLGTSSRYHLWAFDTRYGEPLWKKDHPFDRDHHGGTIQHPVIVGDRLYSVKHAFALRSGDVLRDDLPERRGCGTMSASNHSFFFRHHFHGMWDLETNARTQFEGIRGGCWLGIVPAGGVALAPETSSGCFCTHAIQISVAWAPRLRGRD